MDAHYTKIDNQDKQIGELVLVTKQANKQVLNLNDKLLDQNVKLKVIEKDMERVEEKMMTTREKFDNFIENSNFCCLYIVILLELAGLISIIIFIK